MKRVAVFGFVLLGFILISCKKPQTPGPEANSCNTPGNVVEMTTTGQTYTFFYGTNGKVSKVTAGGILVMCLMEYDSQNRLIKKTNPFLGDTTIASYDYQPDGVIWVDIKVQGNYPSKRRVIHYSGSDAVIDSSLYFDELPAGSGTFKQTNKLTFEYISGNISKIYSWENNVLSGYSICSYDNKPGIGAEFTLNSWVSESSNDLAQNKNNITKIERKSATDSTEALITIDYVYNNAGYPTTINRTYPTSTVPPVTKLDSQLKYICQ